MNLLGQRLGTYQLVRLLGEGGYAQVYLGQHELLDMQAAIKVVQNRFSEPDIARFLHEARAVANLHHAHIVRVLECAVAEGRPYLVMEYAPGGTVRQHHPDGIPLVLTMVERYVQQVSEALQSAHDQQIIHRDVKPENLLIGAQGQLLLADFGVALLTQGSSLLPVQEVAGTTAYMAPEQLQGHPRRASDQYALGVMVYEWLTGRPLFTGSVPELIAHHLHAPPRSPRELVPTISQPVEAVVLRALAKDPKARFPSVQAFADAFAEACQATDGAPSTLRLRPIRSPAIRLEPAPAVARQGLALPVANPQEGGPPQPVPALAPLAPVESAEPAAPFPGANDAQLEPVRAKPVAFRWPFHLLPFHVGLVVLLLVLVTSGGILWQATRFQQTVVTGKYVISLGLLGVDPVKQAVEDESDTFRVGTTVELEGTIARWNGYAEARLLRGASLVATQQWQVSDAFTAPPALQSSFSVSARLTQVGSYRWEIDLTSDAGGSVAFVDGYITFLVT